jgi:hypothetical protein
MAKKFCLIVPPSPFMMLKGTLPLAALIYLLLFIAIILDIIFGLVCFIIDSLYTKILISLPALELVVTIIVIADVDARLTKLYYWFRILLGVAYFLLASFFNVFKGRLVDRRNQG